MAYSTVAQNIVVSFTPSDHNGYHISCFGKQDGSINTSVSGGVPPYTYSWSNQGQGPNLSGLAAGYYRLVVSDANNLRGEAEITLIEPASLTVNSSISMYPNGFNISCYDCYNGSITITAANGISPYSYSWADGPVTQNRNVLGAGIYHVTVTDANACSKISEPLILGQPDRGDWTMEGNSGTDPDLNYLGTSDSVDLVFKSNGQERLRLTRSGEISLMGTVDVGVLYLDENGILRGGGGPGLINFDPVLPSLCGMLGSWATSGPFWKVGGNNFSQLCPQEVPVLGTLSNTDLRLIANGNTHLIITPNGRIGIGTEDMPGGAITDYRLYVEDGMVTREVLVQTGPWPDYVFEPEYELMPLEELREHIAKEKHLPGIPTAADIEKAEGVALGDMQARFLKVMEEQALYILQLEEQMKKMEQRLSVLEATEH